MRIASLRQLALLVLLTVTAIPASAGVRAWLDRTEIALGETVTLNVQVDGAGADTPDFSILAQDFEVLGSSSSSQISISNGQRSASTLFAVGLSPLREGVLTLPPFEVAGERSEPLLLTVKPATVSTGAGGDVYIETEVQPREPYVQQEVIYTLRLFYAVGLIDGQLDAPAPAGVRVARLGEDSKYQVERGGRRYMVIERRFALTPERSGELRLDPARFSGRGMDRNGLGGMFGGGTRLAAAGDPIVLQVRPKPETAPVPWLPARSLKLDVLEAQAATQAKVGEPVSLTLRLRAQGLSADQLPELALADIAGAAVYPDQETARDQSNAQGLATEKTRRFAIVPTAPGVLEIPEQVIEWWDVAADRAQRSVVPARRIEVRAADGSTAPSPPGGSDAPVVAAPDPAPVAAPAASSAPAASPSWQDWAWPALSVFLALGWLLSHWRARRARARVLHSVAQPVPVLRGRSGPDLDEALRSGELPRIALALRSLAPADCGPGLDAIADRLQADPQAQAVRMLERALYAQGDDGNELLLQLRTAFRSAPRWRPSDRRTQDPDRLPPLYR